MVLKETIRKKKWFNSFMMFIIKFAKAQPFQQGSKPNIKKKEVYFYRQLLDSPGKQINVSTDFLKFPTFLEYL